MQLSEKLPYPVSVKTELSIAHANAISKFIESYSGTFSERRNIIDKLNLISYMYISGNTIPDTWNIDDPLNVPISVEYEEDMIETLRDVYIRSERDIDWGNVPKIESEAITEKDSSESDTVRKMLRPDNSMDIDSSNQSSTILTDKSDLYIQPPTIPVFDYDDKFASGYIDGVPYVIYKSLPVIPTKQNEISVSTDVSMMSESDLLRLFPNNIIHTRAASMYERVDGLSYDDELGVILPINGFTEEQVRDNIIKYPHLFKLLKEVDGRLVSFYSTVELDGKLHKIVDAWKLLPEASKIPYNREFVKEYVVRRYLLERDIYHIHHVYPMFGRLDPFLTLFMPYEEYKKNGYNNSVDIAKQCVNSRVSYKTSRNPVLRRLENV